VVRYNEYNDEMFGPIESDGIELSGLVEEFEQKAFSYKHEIRYNKELNKFVLID
jgi:hypothetical protein